MRADDVAAPSSTGVAPSFETRRFPLRFTRVYRVAAQLFGVSPRSAWADVAADSLLARFGPWTLRTSLVNISTLEITGPYAISKTAGPARLSLSDRGLSFATNGERGVLLTFHQPVPALAPFGWLRHPELTITVADIDGFVGLLKARGAASR